MKIFILNWLLFLCSSTGNQYGWIEKKSEIGRFYLSYPTSPTYTYGTFHGWSAKDQGDQVSYLMAFREFNSSEKVTISAIEKYLLPSMMEGDIQVSKSYSTFDGNKSIEFLYKTNTAPELFKKGRIIVKSQKLYILQVHYYHKELEDFNKFSSSLRFY